MATLNILTVAQTVSGGAVISLAAETLGGAVRGLQWSGSGVFSSPNSLNTNWTAPASQDMARVYTLTLSGLSGLTETSASVDITVAATPENVRPEVDITTADQTVDGSARISLQATATDSDGSIASYRWSGSGTFGSATAKDTAWVAPAGGLEDTAYILRLQVTDNDGATNADTVTITVRAAPRPPTVSISSPNPFPAAVDGGTRLSLVATADDPDGPNSEITYAWTGDGTFSATNTANPNWTAPNAQIQNRNYTFTVTVTDQSGLTASASKTLAVRGTGRPPEVVVNTADQNVDAGDDLVLSATATGPDNPITGYLWSGSGTFSSRSVRNPTWTAPDARTTDQAYTLTLRVTDSRGRTAVDNVVLTVPGVTQELAVSIQTPAATVSGGAIVALAATATAAPGTTITSYAWTGSGTFASATSEDTNWTAPAAQDSDTAYVLTLTVVDSLLRTVSATVTITVAGTVTGPRVEITNRETEVAGGGMVTLATTVTPVEGTTIASYAWTVWRRSTSGLPLLSDPAGSFSDAAVQNPVWTAPPALEELAFYELTIIVTDSEGATGSAFYIFDVPAIDPAPVVTILTDEQVIVHGSTLVLNATAVASEGSTIMSLQWSGLGAFSDDSILTPVWTAPSGQIGLVPYRLVLTATDSENRIGTASITISVQGIIAKITAVTDRNQSTVARATGLREAIRLIDVLIAINQGEDIVKDEDLSGDQPDMDLDAYLSLGGPPTFRLLTGAEAPNFNADGSIDHGTFGNLEASGPGLTISDKICAILTGRPPAPSAFRINWDFRR